MMRSFLLGCLGLLAASMIHAHTGASGVVLERMEGMSAMERGLKTIKPAMQGGGAVDLDQAREVGSLISEHAGNMVDLFEEGTSGGVSEASDSIWQEMDRFTALAAELAALGDELSVATEDTVARELYFAINRNCGTCHDDYRLDD